MANSVQSPYILYLWTPTTWWPARLLDPKEHPDVISKNPPERPSDNLVYFFNEKTPYSWVGASRFGKSHVIHLPLPLPKIQALPQLKNAKPKIREAYRLMVEESLFKFPNAHLTTPTKSIESQNSETSPTSSTSASNTPGLLQTTLVDKESIQSVIPPGQILKSYLIVPDESFSPSIQKVIQNLSTISDLYLSGETESLAQQLSTFYDRFPISVSLLRQTRAGFVINFIRLNSKDPLIQKEAADLLLKFRDSVKNELLGASESSK